MRTISQAFSETAREKPRRVAVVHGAMRKTYAELEAEVARLAAGLRRQGLQSGERVVLLLPPGDAFTGLFFATVRCGAVAVPLDPELHGDELGRLLKQIDPSFLVQWVQPEAGRSTRAAHEGLVASSSLKAVLHAGPSTAAGCIPLWPPIGAPARDPSPGPEARLSDPAAVFRTSGTSGPPRSVVHTHRSLMHSVETLEALRREFFSGPPARLLRVTAVASRYRQRLLRTLRNQVWMTPMSPHSIAGFRIFLQALLSGHRLVIVDRFHPAEGLEVIQNENVTIFAAAPTMLEAMLRVRDFDRYHLSSLAVIGLGSAPTRPGLVKEARQRFGCPVLVGYGSTETGGGLLVTRMYDNERLSTSTVGRAFPGAEVKIVDESREDLPPGAVGEVACRSGGLMTGYLDASPADRGALGDDGWYYTGDIGVVDAEGYVRILGRKSDVIIRGGQKVLPGEVEAVLQSHPAIAGAAVVGIPRPFVGDLTWAFVVRRAGCTIRGGDVRRYCAERLAIYKVPDHVRFVEQLPTAESGEVKKHELRGALHGGGGEEL